MKIVITRQLPQEAMALLRAHADTVEWPHAEQPASRSFLEEHIGDADGVVCLLTERIDAALLARAPRLKAVGTMSVGYNHIDVKAATERGVLVTNTPDVLTETTADLAFALLMATARRLVEASDYLRRGQWTTWSPLQLTGMDVFGATLGIIGMGRIGEAVARRAQGFGMNVLYHNRSRKPEAEERLGLTYAELPRLLSESDFVVVLTPYTPQTAGLIRKEQLQLMKPTAVLINIARGGIVDEADLYDALRSGSLWAAGLDVFETEPVPASHPLLTLPNVVTLPHIGSASVRTRTQMALLAAEGVLQALAGQRPRHVVNPEAYAR
ncbi:2-hydroxyacid dehydrogenase [Gordoniibacillus kamchatkensis]